MTRTRASSPSSYISEFEVPRHQRVAAKSMKSRATHLREVFEDICAYCGVALNDRTRTVDHIVPRAQGGRHHFENTCLACKPCNRKKGNRNPAEAGMHPKLVRLPQPDELETS